MKIMGILNITEDSFSDGGLYLDPKKAEEQALQMLSQGADIIDIGGQSTRPNSKPVPIKIEEERVIPIVKQLSLLKKQANLKKDFYISVDTYEPEIAQKAIMTGADIINDVSGTNTVAIVAKHPNVKIVIMHNRMSDPYLPHAKTDTIPYQNVVEEVIGEMQSQIKMAMSYGVKKEQIIMDVGIGFAKNYNDNISLLKALDYIKKKINLPLLVGASRKRFLQSIIDAKHPSECDIATVATTIHAYLNGCDYVRVHNVKMTKEALTVFQTINNV